MADDNLKELRAKAREAMMGEEYRQKFAARQEERAKAREEARRAMEGSLRRAKREELEKTAKEQELEKRKIEETMMQKKEAERIKQEQEEKRKKEQAEAEAKEHAKREQMIRQSQNVIEAIKKESEESLPPLRTLKSDLAKLSQKEGLSSAKIAIAEDKRRGAPTITPQEAPSKTKLPVILISIFFLAGASILMGLFLWQGQKTAPVTTPTVKVSSLIFADQTILIDTTNKRPNDLIKEINKFRFASSSEGIINFYFVQSTSTKGVITNIPLNSSQIFQSLGIALPENQTRFLDLAQMIGLDKVNNTLFFVFRSSAPEYLRAEVSSNEGNFLSSLLSPFIADPNQVRLIRFGNFRDRSIKNIDERIIRNDKDEILALYSFIDSNTLLITTSEETLSRLIDAYRTGQTRTVN